MNKPARRQRGQSAIELLESSVRLLRTMPVGALLSYYIGSIPCLLGLLYFISDMFHGAFARQHVIEASLSAAGLYLWMKCWHSVFVSKLHAHLLSQPESPWTVGRVIRMAMIQIAIQPAGLFLRFAAAQIILPYVWTYGFFQNVSILGDGTRSSTREVIREAARQAGLRLWPAHRALGSLFLFTVFVWLNLFILLIAIPGLLNTFFGEESAFSRNIFAMLNSTTFATSLAATYLCIDPMRKALCVLRCFHGASLRSGEDLRVELRSFRTPASSAAVAVIVAGLLLTSLCAPARAQEAAPAPASAPRVESRELDGAVDRVLTKREYSWRLPRQVGVEEEKGWLTSFLEQVKKWVDDAFKTVRDGTRKLSRWFRDLMKGDQHRDPGDSGAFNWAGTARWTLLLLVAALLAIVIVLLWRWRARREPESAIAEAGAVPDLNEEGVTADQLPEDGWLQLARDLAARGEYRLALRALYLAGLAHLGQRHLISIARHKSNRDYDRELRRRARENPDLLQAFDTILLTFEAAWYGDHPVTSDTIGGVSQTLERIRAC